MSLQWNTETVLRAFADALPSTWNVFSLSLSGDLPSYQD